jgi:endonuclease/exonuclease/phosphatase family metal-dependent hydrolase
MRILSLNTSLLSFCFSEYDYKPNLKKRAQTIASKILAMNTSCDVLCFQEAFDAPSKEILTNTLKPLYPYIYSDVRSGAFLVGVNSGLMIFSKYKIIDRFIKTYKYATGDSFLSKKSIMGVCLQVENETVCVFNTHMQAGGNTKWYLRLLEPFTPNLSTNQIRMTQLDEAKKAIFTFIRGKKSVFMGDFNINAYSNTQFINPITNQPIEVSKMIQSVFPNSDTFDPEINHIIYSIYENKKIDYALTLGEKGYSYIISYFTQEDTDHRGVIFESK